MSIVNERNGIYALYNLKYGLQKSFKRLKNQTQGTN